MAKLFSLATIGHLPALPTSRVATFLIFENLFLFIVTLPSQVVYSIYLWIDVSDEQISRPLSCTELMINF